MSTSIAEAVQMSGPRARRGSRPRRARRGLAIVGAAALATPQAGFAQVAPGYSGRSEGGIEYMDHEEAMRTLSAFGNCYAQRSTARAFELLGTEPGSREEASTYRRLFSSDDQYCLTEQTELRMPVAYVRGAIAEGLLERDIAVPAILIRAAPAPGTEVRKLSEAGRCFAATHRADVRSLLATPPGSRRQMEALSPMADDFYRCLPVGAQNLRLDATQLRYVLAEALLRLPATTGTR